MNLWALNKHTAQYPFTHWISEKVWPWIDLTFVVLQMLLHIECYKNIPLHGRTDVTLHSLSVSKSLQSMACSPARGGYGTATPLSSPTQAQGSLCEQAEVPCLLETVVSLLLTHTGEAGCQLVCCNPRSLRECSSLLPLPQGRTRRLEAGKLTGTPALQPQRQPSIRKKTH